MSVRDTLAHQRRRLSQLRLRTVELPALRDVDDMDDARAVAADAPHTLFATTLAGL
jgi:uncharacterized protein